MASSCFIALLCLLFIPFNTADAKFILLTKVRRGIPIAFLSSTLPPLSGLSIELVSPCSWDRLLRFVCSYLTGYRHCGNYVLVGQRHDDLFGFLHILFCSFTVEVAITDVCAGLQITIRGTISPVEPSKSFFVILRRPFS